MKYIVETNEYGSTFYSEEFDTVVEAIEEMAYRWRLLLPTKESEFRRNGYLLSDKVTPYMAVIRTVPEVVDDSTVHTHIVDIMTLADMIEQEENEEE